MRRKIRLLIPNSLTLAASLSALAAIYIAYRWEQRTFACLLLLSGVLDAIDGPIARHLEAQSRFGQIYDVMSDFLAFGIAPAVSLVFLGLLHPAIALLYVVAIQFRLTRYSATPENEQSQRFFQGLSAPDCVYTGVFFGLLPHSHYNWGFALVSLLAVYPGRLMPKGYRIWKILFGVGVTLVFIYYG